MDRDELAYLTRVRDRAIRRLADVVRQTAALEPTAPIDVLVAYADEITKRRFEASSLVMAVKELKHSR